MAFKYTDAVFRITNDGLYCDFCEAIFATAEQFQQHRRTHPPFGHVEKAVLLALANHANDEGVCWPGYTLLSKETFLSRASVSKGINNLCEIGIVTRERSQRYSTVYRLNIETDRDVIEAKQRRAMKDAGIDIPTETVRLRGKTYRRVPKEDIQPSMTAFNIEDEDDFLQVSQ
jgi:hypothetical protein